MSTRSYICMETEPGKYVGSYCHCDGYLTYNGAMLLDHYSNREKVERLISLGDMSTLNENIDPNPLREHSFDDPQNGVTVFYGRDRGEKGTEAREVTLDDVNAPDSWIEYCYVYGLDGKWRYMECGEGEPCLKDLSEGLKEEYERIGLKKRPRGFYGFFTKEDVELLNGKEMEM